MSQCAKTVKKAPRKSAAPAKRGKAAIKVKRAYDTAEASDGLRILIDRLWPRGMKKDSLKIDLWPKHLAPSDDLRRWYHGGGSFEEFRRRYLAELKAKGESLAELRSLLRGHMVTLITAVRELDRSHAAVLAEALAD